MLAKTRLGMAAAGRGGVVGPATITYVGGTQGSGFASSRTIAQPTGVRQFDIGIIVGRVIGAPSGWTACTIGYWKVYGASEGSVVVPSSSGSSQNMTATLSVFRNVHTSTPFDAESTPKSSTGGTLTSNAVTAVHDRTALVSAVTAGVSSGSPALTIPAGMSTGPLGSVNNSCAGTAWLAGPSAGGASGTPSWTVSISAISSSVTNVLLRPYDT